MQQQVQRRKPTLRVKTGCFTCRNRKKKCDESRPICAACLRIKLPCKWPTTLDQSPPSADGFPDGNDTIEVALSGSSPERDIRQSSTSSPEPGIDLGNDEASIESPPLEQCESSIGHSPERSSLPVITTDAATAIAECLEDVMQDVTEIEVDADETVEDALEATSNALATLSQFNFNQTASSEQFISMPLIPSTMPGLDAQSFELMGHYLGRTALSMGNGSTTENPFIVQLIPLSFANPVVLELILSQSASHRAVLDGQDRTNAIAQTYYTKSIRQFRKAVNDYLAGNESSPLWITIGALIMCFTETAKGDTNGVIFDHLQAVGPLVVDLVSKHRHVLPDELRAFVTEYYVYTAIISMISMEPSATAAMFLATELEYEAQLLVENGYVGQLCGSWLSLLLLIPHIFDFGHRRAAASVQPPFPTADDFLNFCQLQTSINSFYPSPSANAEVTLCGYIFQQAVHLYLLTSLGVGDAAQITQQVSIENVLSSAFLYLEQLPASARINTSMCWALAIIGVCTPDDDRRDILRQRLGTMFVTIGLGNISSTLALLEKSWARPQENQSPWNISQIMYEHEIWISFA
ncbi:hypothetical protein FSARC_8839 [Fusarium sarcochroum]|uniref:Zn(2)-C6 fungal-type domain-containing protein n=1 Tax=Fusarium sarcochroum TaxID=1208366 RepID=A0A8H4TS37_9HYPO|nr:hypothetical protein FSARC_8839 [Fusarium sarcochroum]